MPSVTVNAIHFEDFSGHQFERLVLAYHVRTGRWRTLEWYGEVGSDLGRDILGVEEAAPGTVVCIQCVNREALTLSKANGDLTRASAAIAATMDVDAPRIFRFVCRSTISAEMRDKIKAHATTVGFERCDIWSGSDFEERLRASTETENLLQRFVDGITFPDAAAELAAFVRTPSEEGLSCFRMAMAAYTRELIVPGTSLRLTISDAFFWPTVRRVDDTTLIPTTVEDGQWSAGEPVTVRNFPRFPGDHAILEGPAGGGKSAVVQAIAHRTLERGSLAILLRCTDFARAAVPIRQYLERDLCDDFSVAVHWEQELERGDVTILLDGLDEVDDAAQQRIAADLCRFTVRYPLTPWLITTRDAGAVLHFFPSSEVWRVGQLGFLEIEPFCRPWSSGRTSGLFDAAVAAIRRAPLPYLPLYVALQLDHCLSSGVTIPRGPAEVLDGHVQRSLHERLVGFGEHDPVNLRRTVEAIARAFVTLGTAHLRDDELLTTTPIPPESLHRALMLLEGAGLLWRRAGVCGFHLQTIQEYLSGCSLAREPVAELLALAKRQTRPWSQMLTFAIQRHAQADEVVQHLLDEPDDPFSTQLRLAAESVASGARVRESTRERLAKAVAARWLETPQYERQHLTPVLAKFSSPIRPEVKQHLLSATSLDEHEGEMVTAAEDDAFTRELMTRLLQLGFPGFRWTWQGAVDRIATEALARYLVRARAVRTDAPEREYGWIASLISKLDAGRIMADELAKARRDDSLPAVIRVGAHMAGSAAPLPQDAEPLVLQAFERLAATETPSRSFHFDLISDALWRLADAETHWSRVLRRVDGLVVKEFPHRIPEASTLSARDWWWRMVMYTPVRYRPLDAARLVSSEAAHVKPETPRWLFARLTAAAAGDGTDLSGLISHLDHADLADVRGWLQLASKIRTLEPMRSGFSRLALRTLDERSMTDLSGTIAFLVTWDAHFTDLGTGMSGMGRYRHPAAAAAADLFLQWVGRMRYEEHALSTLARAAQLVPQNVAGELRARLQPLLERTVPVPDLLDNAVAEAIAALATTPHRLEVAELTRLGRRSRHNAAHRVHELLRREATPEALEALLHFYNAAHAITRRSIGNHVQQLSVGLGVRLERDGKDMLVMAHHRDQ